MASVEFDLLGAFEGHDVEGIRAIMDAGLDVGAPIKGKSIVNSLRPRPRRHWTDLALTIAFLALMLPLMSSVRSR